MERGFFVLAYDIVDDRRRQKIARLCEAVAQRVQGSVFEGYFSEAELTRLLTRLKRIYKEKEDSLRVYNLCASCREHAQAYGRGQLTSPPGLVIV